MRLATDCFDICVDKRLEEFLGLIKLRVQRGESMNTTLLIMAAGIGSRFGTGIKQLEPVDDAGHIIIDYSIHDAI